MPPPPSSSTGPSGQLHASPTEKVALIAGMCREVLSAATFQEALDLTVRGLVESVGYYSASVGLMDSTQRFLVNQAWCTRGQLELPEGHRQEVYLGIPGRAIRTQEPAIVACVDTDADYLGLFPDVQSEICLPLIARGEAIGVLDVNHDEPEGFGAEGPWLETLSGLLAQIIEKNQLLREVEETRDYLEGLIGAAGEAIITTDPDGRIQRWNRAAERMLGYRQEEVLGTQVSAHWHPEEAPEANRLFQRVASGEVVELQEARRLHRDGRILDVLQTLSPINDATGRVVGVSSIVRDVSERRRMELQFVEMHRNVAASEEKYRSLVEHAQEAIFLVDAVQFTIQEANPCAAELTQLSAERLVGLLWTDLVLQEDADSARRHLETAASTGAASALEVRIRRPDERSLFLEITASAVHAGADRFLQVMGRDVTERRLAEAERETMRNRLMQSEKLTVMGELISGVAHELNNPLTGVIGYAQLLLNQPPDGSLRKNLERIQYEASRCHRIVQNLLGFARQQRTEWKSVGVNQLLEETLELRAYQMRADNIWLVREFDENLPPVEGDAHLLQQVFVNLLQNAHQSMASTGKGGVLTVSTRVEGEKVAIRIADNGPGIPEDIRKRIFETFFTTKGAGEGTGLGLSICHGIVRDHEGDIQVTSRPGVETAFVVKLPVARLGLAGSEGQEDDAAEAGQEIREKPRRVLVVDDEETILEFLSEALRCRGHRVECAANGLHAMQRLRDGEYDAVITDLKMPGMSGRQLYEALRRERPQLADRVIFATGDLVGQDTMEFLRSTGNTYLEKPFSIRSLAQALERLDAQNSESSPGR